jgi:hypothetical protein
LAKTKIDTYIGFAIKSGNVTFGADAIKMLKGGVYLLIICATAGKSTEKVAIKLKDKFNCPMLICKSGLDNVVFKTNCKLIAIRDKNLANAIAQNVDENYEIMLGGNN